MNSCLRDVRSSAHPSALLPSRRELQVPLVVRMLRPPGAQFSHQRVIACHSRSDPFPRKRKKSPSKPSQPKALPRSSGSMRIVSARQFFESQRGEEDSSHPIQSFATGQFSRTADSPPRYPSLSQKDGGQKENNYRHQRRGRENKRRSTFARPRGAGLSPCRRQMPRLSLGPAASWRSLQPHQSFDMKCLREQIEQMHFRDFVADVWPGVFFPFPG